MTGAEWYLAICAALGLTAAGAAAWADPLPWDRHKAARLALLVVMLPLFIGTAGLFLAQLVPIASALLDAALWVARLGVRA